MATNQQFSETNDLWHMPVEWTITAAGAVVPNADGTTTTEPLISVVRASAGTYTVTIPGNFQRVVQAQASYRAAAASSIQAQVTAVGLGTGVATASGAATTAVTVITGNSNAVPAAADQAAGVIGLKIYFVKHKI